MDDLEYIIAGYAVTIAMLVGYRWRLAVRARRARRYLSTVNGRARAER